MNEIIQYFIELPIWELLAVITALLYVYFAARENILCWLMALISTTIYTVIFYDVYLWMDSLLQVYYFGMAVYGWYCWRTIKSDANTVEPKNHLTTKTVQISSWTLQKNLVAIASLSVISLVVGYFMANYTPTSFPYIDAATTVFAIFATYLVTQKVIDNWWYWIVIDLVSIFVYIEKSLTPTAFLFAVYVIFAVYGYISWKGRLQPIMSEYAASERAS